MKNETPSISDILKKKILEFEAETKAEYVGKVIESGDGIAHIKGLPQAMAGEMIEFQSGIFGLVFNLERDQIVAVILGSHTSVKEGMCGIVYLKDNLAKFKNLRI